MAFSETTGELILRAAQGLSQTLNLQAQLVQRQAEEERTHQLRLETAKAERDAAKQKADQAEQRLALGTAELQLKLQTEKRLQETAATQQELNRARTAKLTEDIRLGPKGRSDLAFIQKENYNRGTILTFQNQFAQKSQEWGFGKQSVVSPELAGLPDGGKREEDITEVFNNLGGIELLDSDRLWAQRRENNRQRAAYMEENSLFIGQEDKSGGESANSKAVRAALAVFDARDAAYRAGLKALGDINLQFSPTQLRNLGGGNDPIQRSLNDLSERRDSLMTQYLNATSMGHGSRMVLDETLQGVASPDNKTSVEALREHVRTKLGPTREKAINSPGFPHLQRYMDTFFPTREESRRVMRDVLAGMP